MVAMMVGMEARRMARRVTTEGSSTQHVCVHTRMYPTCETASVAADLTASSWDAVVGWYASI